MATTQEIMLSWLADLHRLEAENAALKASHAATDCIISALNTRIVDGDIEVGELRAKLATIRTLRQDELDELDRVRRQRDELRLSADSDEPVGFSCDSGARQPGF